MKSHKHKFNIGDKLIGEDYKQTKRNGYILLEVVGSYHWTVRDITKRYYSLWNDDLKYIKLFSIDVAEVEFSLDVVAMRKVKLNRIERKLS